VRIKGYYTPWTTKVVPYREIRSVHRRDIGPMTGRWRIWGSGALHTWANFDPARPRKHVGFDLDTGHHVHPIITPDDPDAVERILHDLVPDVEHGGDPEDLQP